MSGKICRGAKMSSIVKEVPSRDSSALPNHGRREVLLQRKHLLLSELGCAKRLAAAIHTRRARSHFARVG